MMVRSPMKRFTCWLVISGVIAAGLLAGCVETEWMDPATEIRPYEMTPVRQQRLPDGRPYMSEYETAPRLYEGFKSEGFHPPDYEVESGRPTSPAPYRFQRDTE